MKLRIITISVFVVATVFLQTGCKEKHNSRYEVEINTPVPIPVKPKELSKLHPVWTEMHNKELHFTEMYARMRVRGHYDNQTQSFNAEMRWEKGKQIWMSFTIFGIEGMRVVITPDSMKVIDRMNKRYFLKPFNFINEKAFLNISYSELENLLLGEMVMANPLVSKVSESSEVFTVSSDTNGMINLATFNRSPFSLKEQRLQYPAVMRNLLATFGSFKPLGNGTFAWERYLRATDGTREFWAEVGFNEVNINKKLSYPFEVNTKYKKVD